MMDKEFRGFFDFGLRRADSAEYREVMLALFALAQLPIWKISELADLAGEDDPDFAADTPEQPPEPASASITIKAAPKTATGQYKAQYLGEELRSDILWDLFKQIVELSEDLDPEFVKELSTRILRSRRAVSKTRDGVHLRSKHLIVETQQTRGGYWISKNIGKDDLRRQCELLCNVAGLKFAYDLKLDLSGRD